MDDVMPTVQALASWIERNGYTSVGAFRELYLEFDPDHCEAWVTELQEGIAS
jgi:effector-binding domain-containing protein